MTAIGLFVHGLASMRARDDGGVAMVLHVASEVAPFTRTAALLCVVWPSTLLFRWIFTCGDSTPFHAAMID